MSKQIKVPKDLGIKIGTESEVFWKNVKEKAEEDIKRIIHEIEINKLIVEGAKEKIAVEKEKFK